MILNPFDLEFQLDRLLLSGFISISNEILFLILPFLSIISFNFLLKAKFRIIY